MPRTARAAVGNVCYHVLNRGNAQQTVFHSEADYASFCQLLAEANERAKCAPMRLLSYCLMPNHFHLLLWPREDGDLGRWMQWLLTSHVRRYHRVHGTSGHVWQGRFKAFPIQSNEHLLTVMRYVERNPVRAKSIPVRRAERWPWSSIGEPPQDVEVPKLTAPPEPRADNWLEWVNTPLTVPELAAARESVVRGRPFGNPRWVKTTGEKLGLQSTLRPRGRPRRSEK